MKQHKRVLAGLRLRGGHSGDGICPESGAAPVVPVSPSVTPMVFVLGVFLIAWRTQGYFWGIASSLVSVMAVNYAFTISLLGVQPDPPGVSGLCGGDADGVHHDQHHDNPDQAAGADEGRGGKGADAGQSPAGGVPRSAHAPDLHLRRMFRHVGRIPTPCPGRPISNCCRTSAPTPNGWCGWWKICCP